MDNRIEDAWHAYIGEALRRDNPWGVMPRCMLLLLRGENAVRCLKQEVIGSFTEQPVGDTVRGTFGDFICDSDGQIRHFEPAVITCPDPALNDRHLKLLADHAVVDGGILEGCYQYDNAPNVECSLVMLKPDNFYRPSRRPGNIIDTFSRTGLRIVAVKLFNMTVAKGQEFYGPLQEIFVSKLKFLVARRVMDALGSAFNFEFTEDDADVLADHLAERNAACEFSRIVEYMTGIDPESIDEAEKATASNAKCLAMLYEGPDAIAKVREVLGSTDPSKAEPGTVRSDFGRDLMRNGAHASDSPENAIRERGIVGLVRGETDTCDITELINAYLNDR
jgi:nucleoside diphosphate kinase